MSLILKSKDIYEKPTNIGYKKNVVLGVQLDAMDWEFAIGEVSPKYTNVYFERDENDKLTFLNSGTKKSFPVDYFHDIVLPNSTSVVARFHLSDYMKIEKIIDLSRNQYGSIIEGDYILVRERTWEKEGTTLYSDRISNVSNYATYLDYEKSTNAFKTNLNLDYQKESGAEQLIWYTEDGGWLRRMSETFVVVGRYRETINKSYYGGSSAAIMSIQLPSNELIRADMMIIGETNPYVTVLVNGVYDVYKKGKEIYTLKCALGNYYDENGILKVSIDDESLPYLIPKHTVVTPYVFSAVGEVPLSTKADGSAKLFEVIGTDFQYSGVPWQTLTIQEYV
jgi:hypothetical protein